MEFHFPKDLKNSLIKELESFFGDDKPRVKHAKEVLQFAEELLKSENGDPEIVIPTAIFHDVGIKIAEEKYGSSAPPLQEKEGPPIARKILSRYNFKEKEIDEICTIISHHHSRHFLKTINSRIIFDADWLVNFGNEAKISDKNRIRKIINRLYFTNTAKEIAKNLYIHQKTS